MRVSSYRRSNSKRVVRFIAYVTSFLLFLDCYTHLAAYKTFNRNLVTNTISRREDLPIRARNQKVYIVAQFWTSAEIIVDHWADAILDLVDALGRDNVFISILESGSLDNTVEILEWLDRLLQERRIRRRIVTDPTTHKDAVEAGDTYPNGTAKQGWIYTGDSKPPGQKELRRIPYLAELRNRCLEPMLEMYREDGIKFDKILYLNDVIFKPSDVLSLLATNDGVYDVACALDFHYPPEYYDTFVLRDSSGHATSSRRFPFFRSRTSRKPMLKGLPAPVNSCWNGMILADTAPYYDQTTAVETYDLDGRPITTHEGLKFRGVPDALATLHVEASECCLIHADLIDRGQVKKGMYINPSVRVGYTETIGLTSTSYDLVHTGPTGLGYLTLREYFMGVWQNRYLRWTRPAWYDMKRVWWRMNKWKKEGKALGEVREEPGIWCTVDEMQILIWNGWKHVW